MSLSNTELLTVPKFTLTGGTWSNGKYLINPSQTLTITSNSFAGWGDGTLADAVIGYGISGPGGEVWVDRFYSEEEPTSDAFISRTIAGGSLIAGNDYTFEGFFNAMTDIADTDGDVLAAAFFEYSTSLTISAIPEPSTYAAMVGAVALLGAACWRRRQKA